MAGEGFNVFDAEREAWEFLIRHSLFRLETLHLNLFSLLEFYCLSNFYLDLIFILRMSFI